MPERIPVFFLPCVPPDAIDAEAAQAIIAEAYADPEAAHLTTAVSSNWWHQSLTSAMG